MKSGFGTAARATPKATPAPIRSVRMAMSARAVRTIVTLPSSRSDIAGRKSTPATITTRRLGQPRLFDDSSMIQTSAATSTANQPHSPTTRNGRATSSANGA